MTTASIEAPRRGVDPKGPTPLLEMCGIGKRFPGVVANDDVDFDVLPGEVHTLFGENGAGKSTLMRVLYGIYRPDAGEIRLRGEPVTIASPGGCDRARYRDDPPALHAREHADGRRERRARPPLVARPAHGSQPRRTTDTRARRALRPRRRSGRSRVAALGRRAPARGDPQGAVQERAAPHPRRADRRAHAARGRRPVRRPARDGRRRARPRLHLAQDSRGPRALGPHHGDARRALRRDRAAGRRDPQRARRDDGRTRAAVAGAGTRGRAPPKCGWPCAISTCAAIAARKRCAG